MTFPGFASTLKDLKYTDCYRYIEHVLGGPVAPELTPRDIVDQAGEHLVSINPWNWLTVRTAELKLRSRISFTGATWTLATKKITKASAFSAYEYVSGDTVEITGGTGATLRRFLLDAAQAPTANDIFLTEVIGAADATANIAGTMHNDTVRLPEIIREARSLTATDALVRGLSWVTMEEIIQKRTSQIDVSSSWNFYGAISFTGSPPRPILEIWPSVVATDPKGLTLSYRVGWLPGTNDTDILPLPSYMHACFLRLVRIFALGYEEGDESDKKSIDVLLSEFQMSPLLREAMSRDGAIQPSYGMLRGGAAQRAPRNIRRLLANQVDAPA